MRSFIQRLHTVGLQDLGVLIILISCVALQLEGLADDPGVGWHLLTGDFVLDTNSVPRTDLFLHPEGQRPWVVDQWLGSTILAALYRLGSWPGLYASLTILFLFVFCGVLYGGVVAITGRSLGASLAVLFAAKLAQIHFLIRPVVFGFLFFTLVFLWLLKLSREVRDNQELPGLTSVVGIVLLFAVWANIHGSFTLGLLLCGAAAISACYHAGPSLRRKAMLRMGFLMVGAGAATLATPWGVALYQKIVSLSTSSYFMSYHEEWLPPSFFAYEGQLFLLVAVMPIFGMLWAQSRVRRLTAFEVLAFGGMLLLGLRTVRILPFFGIVATPVVAEAISLPFSSFIRGRFPLFTRFGALLGRIDVREGKTARGVLLLFCFCVLLLPTAFGRRSHIPLYQGSFGPSHSKFPVTACHFMFREVLLDDVKGVVVAPPEWGGFITLYGKGELKAVIDDRNLVVGEGGYKEFYQAFSETGDWKGYADGKGARFVLYPTQSRFIQELSQDDQKFIVHHDSLATLLDLSPPDPESVL